MEKYEPDEIVSVKSTLYGNALITTKKFVYEVSLEDEIPVIRRVGKNAKDLTIRDDKG